MLRNIQEKFDQLRDYLLSLSIKYNSAPPRKWNVPLGKCCHSTNAHWYLGWSIKTLLHTFISTVYLLVNEFTLFSANVNNLWRSAIQRKRLAEKHIKRTEFARRKWNRQRRCGFTRLTRKKAPMVDLTTCFLICSCCLKRILNVYRYNYTYMYSLMSFWRQRRTISYLQWNRLTRSNCFFHRWGLLSTLGLVFHSRNPKKTVLFSFKPVDESKLVTQFHNNCAVLQLWHFEHVLLNIGCVDVLNSPRFLTCEKRSNMIMIALYSYDTLDTLYNVMKFVDFVVDCRTLSICICLHSNPLNW